MLPTLLMVQLVPPPPLCVWHGGHLLVANLLGDTVQSSASEQLRATEHLGEVGEGDDLGEGGEVE